MKNYLIELFKDENTVILPGLGALTMVNRATNELMFMSYLKHNDGTLVKHISQKEGIDADQSKAKVDEYVNEINSALERGETFTISQIGSFSKDASGEIQFSCISSENNDSEPIIHPIVEEVKEEVAEIQEEIIEETEAIQEEVEQVNEVILETIEKVEGNTEIPPVEQEIIVPTADKAEVEVKQENPTIAPLSEEEQWNDDLDVLPLNYKPERPKQPILEKTKKDKKPRRNKPLWLILIALIVVGGSAYVGLNYNDLKEKIPFLASNKEEAKEEIEETVEDNSSVADEEQLETIEPDVSKEIIDETIPEVVEVAEEQPKEKGPMRNPALHMGKITVDKSLPIQVIVGSFGEESNAIRLVEKLKSEGFSAEIIGVYGGLHTVSAGSFNSMDEFKEKKVQLESVGTYWVKGK